MLSLYLLTSLVELGFITLAHSKQPTWLNSSYSYWHFAFDLGLGSRWAMEWDRYIFYFNSANIRLNIIEFELFWSFNAAP